jgi:hypothetical protein
MNTAGSEQRLKLKEGVPRAALVSVSLVNGIRKESMMLFGMIKVKYAGMAPLEVSTFCSNVVKRMPWFMSTNQTSASTNT